MKGLVTRIAALESQTASPAAYAKDFRVIDMHLARAEEKIMRLTRSSCTMVDLDLFMLGEM